MTPIAAETDVWDMPQLAYVQSRLACEERWLPPTQQVFYATWMAVRCACSLVSRYWFTVDDALQASTSYGAKRATLQLAEFICLRSAQRPSSVTSPNLGSIDQFIESSRTILELEEDWDGEGASPITESTWQRAARFLRRNASSVLGRAMEALTIVPVQDGSIDLHWKLPHRELLINISPTDDKWATYYGDNRLGWNTVEGKLDIQAPNQWLFVWLTE